MPRGTRWLTGRQGLWLDGVSADVASVARFVRVLADGPGRDRSRAAAALSPAGGAIPGALRRSVGRDGGCMGGLGSGVAGADSGDRGERRLGSTLVWAER